MIHEKSEAPSVRKIGVAGLGIIGQPLYDDLADRFEVVAYDPPRGMDGDLSDCGVVFISVPVPNKEREQDLSIIRSVLDRLHPRAIVFIRSTVIPGTCDLLSKERRLEIYSLPEFLTERRARSDFLALPMLCGGGNTILKLLFPYKAVVAMSNKEAEMAKMFHNMVGVFKVHLANIVYNACVEIGANYEKVKQGALLSGLVNNVHMDVPGPDGHRGSGGSCFPVNLEAFSKYLNNSDTLLLDLMYERNLEFRLSLKDEVQP